MHIFYSQDISGNAIQLGEEEAKHCFKVLRHKCNDIIYITDGRGQLYRCIIEEHQLSHHRIHILETIQPFHQRPYQLEIVVAPTKNAERIEWMIEKLVETGVDQIRFIKTQRTEKGTLKMERLHHKAIAAMKQSLHYTLPEISSMIDFHDLIHEKTDSTKLIAWCDTHHEKKHIQSIEFANKFQILIGPEGDFTPTEVSDALQCGYQPISLGTSRFRTETAALAACMALYFKFAL
ncbi:MAG: 16S rRNA (uracil(1498)-N(3))-methyltransferase [Flavobacteriales bacterium]|nr:16S rRNA (uracil(1498)-N(3))-methyltransferase [Flavobacteriales bacterium]